MRPLWLLFVIACSNAEDTGPSVLGPPRYLGEVTWQTTYPGLPSCDLTVGLTGTPLAGDCPSCDFVFQIDGELLRDDGDEGCVPPIQQVWLTEGSWSPMALGFASVWEQPYYYGYGGSQMRDVLLSGRDTFPGDGTFDWVPLAAADWGVPVTLESGRLSWEWSYRSSYVVWPPFCNDDSELLPEGPFREGVTVEGALTCPSAGWEGWSIPVSAPGVLRVTADTLDAESAFATAIAARVADQCVSWWTTEDFTCTHVTPYGGRCAALELEIEAPGTYEVLIFPAIGACESGSARYALTIEAPGGGTPTRIPNEDMRSEQRWSGDLQVE